MIDYFLSSQEAPSKGAALTGTGLPSLIANIALVVGVILLKPAIERCFSPAIDEYKPNTLENRQSLKAILDAHHDFLSPALDSVSTLHFRVKPVKATIGTAVTVIKSVPTPVQLSQEQSTVGAILGICACMVLALVGTVLVFQHSRQRAYISGTSSFAASSDDADSSPQCPSRDSTPPIDDESSGSGGHPPPVPAFGLFYDSPITPSDNATDTDDEDEVGDMDGAPPPPPPSFPTPVEDGDASKRKPSIFRWLSLTLLLSIISLIINRLFNRFFKGHGKNVSAPTASERITVNEVTANIMPLLPSATAKPAIKPTCPNMLPLIEIERLAVGISSLVNSSLANSTVNSAVSQRSRRFMDFVFSLLVMACWVLLPIVAQYWLDNHLPRLVDYFFPQETQSQPLKALDVVQITGSINDNARVEGEDTDLADDVATGVEGDVAGTDEKDICTDEANVNTGGDEETNDVINSVEQEASFNQVGDTTLTVYGKASPLGIDLEDIFDASEDGIPFHEAFSALSISTSTNKIPVFKETSESLTNPIFRLPSTSEQKCTVGDSQAVKVSSTKIPVVTGQVRSVSKLSLEKTASASEKVSSSAKVDIPSKENTPTVNTNKTSGRTLAKLSSVPVKSSATNTKTSSTESLNPKATAFVPPPHVPVRKQPSPGLSASMHAPAPVRKGLSSSIHAPSSPPKQGLSASIHAPQSLPEQGLSASIHAPSPPPRSDSSASMHTPRTPHKLEPSMELLPIPVVDLSPDHRVRRTIDPRRQCDIIVLVGGGAVSP